MELTLYTNDIAKYLEADEVIDFHHELIKQLSEELSDRAENQTDYIRLVYEYVRDHISHSADIGHDALTCSASEVLKAGVNACFSIDTEQLAFPVRPHLGEKDIFIIYPEPDKKILEKFRMYKTRTELWNDLPVELSL